MGMVELVVLGFAVSLTLAALIGLLVAYQRMRE